jgi:hypothetical protein
MWSDVLSRSRASPLGKVSVICTLHRNLSSPRYMMLWLGRNIYDNLSSTATGRLREAVSGAPSHRRCHVRLPQLRFRLDCNKTAIDSRCSSHGGVASSPKPKIYWGSSGSDGDDYQDVGSIGFFHNRFRPSRCCQNTSSIERPSLRKARSSDRTGFGVGLNSSVIGKHLKSEQRD